MVRFGVKDIIILILLEEMKSNISLIILSKREQRLYNHRYFNTSFILQRIVKLSATFSLFFIKRL